MGTDSTENVESALDENGVKRKPKISGCKYYQKMYRKSLIAILVPLLLLPLVLVSYGTEKARIVAHGAYATIVIIIYWTSEALPLAVTSFFPVTLYPMLGIANTGLFISKYFNDTIMVFAAGLIIALAFEYSCLHKRIALKVIVSIGASPKRLMLGVMLTTAFLSMWMSNTAITALMVPIVQAIMDELDKLMHGLLKEELDLKEEQEKGGTSVPPDEPAIPVDAEDTNAANIVQNNPDPSQLNPVPRTSLQQQPPKDAFEGHGELKFSPDFSLIRNPSDSVLSRKSIISAEELSAAYRRKMKEASLDATVLNLRKMFLMSIAYAANLGGTAMITGSGTNFVARNAFEIANVSPQCDGDRATLGFVQWFVFNLVPVTINLAYAYFFLVLWFIKLKGKCCSCFKSKKNPSGATEAFKITPGIVKEIEGCIMKTYKGLGKMSTHEIGVLFVFIFTVILWVFHEPDIFPGWASLFSKTKPSLSTAGILGALLLFVIPRKLEFYRALCTCNFKDVTFEPCLTWNYAQMKFPWGVLMVLGGGFALSQGVNTSGLGAQIGEWLGILKDLPKEAMLFMVIYLTTFCTEVASNTAIASILVPVLLDISRKFKIHPMFLSLPTTVASSYSFMLPVATPPNAIVFTAGKMKMSDMVIPGFIMNIGTGAILGACTLTWGLVTYNFNTYTLNPNPMCLEKKTSRRLVFE